MGATAYVLVRGVMAMASGKDVSGERQQNYMRKRVLFQAVAIIIVILILVVAGAGLTAEPDGPPQQDLHADGRRRHAGLVDGSRVSKSSPRMRRSARSTRPMPRSAWPSRRSPTGAHADQLVRIQNELFDLGADVATPGEDWRRALRIVAVADRPAGAGDRRDERGAGAAAQASSCRAAASACPRFTSPARSSAGPSGRRWR